MPDGRSCPRCGEDIGWWSVFSAGWPTRIRCPHCPARLSYSGSPAVIVVMLLLLVAITMVGYFAARELADGDSPRGIFLALVFGTWVIIELATVAFLRARRVLQAR